MTALDGDLPRPPASDASGGRRRWPGAASTPPSATGPAHYAAVEAVFAAGLGAVVAIARRRERDGAGPIPLRELPVLALGTFALADVLAKEKVSTWLREPFVREGADHKPDEPEGDGLRYAIGELLTCTRCVGTWSALALVGLRTVSPAAGRTSASVLALAGANDLMQSGFRLLSERTNRAIADAQIARRAAQAE
ncbi:MAG: DUF1360 domain-containing protein [Solirubrobacteraceae bacterium]